MIGGVPDHGLVVGNDHRHALDLMQPHQVDRGQPQAADLAGEPGVGDPRDDAVALPAAEPFRRRIVQAPLLDVHRPRPVLPHVGRDPLQQAPPVTTGRFHENGDAGADEHGARPEASGRGISSLRASLIIIARRGSSSR